MAPIYNKAGKLHLFMSAIPDSGSWNSDSKIVHYTADQSESSYNPITQPTFMPGEANGLHASYPTLGVDVDGKFRIYCKLISDKHAPKMYCEISMVISDNIEGSYVNYPNNPLISYANMNIDIEESFAFFYKGMY